MNFPFARLFWLAFFGVCGVFARYLFGVFSQRAWGASFPYGTLLVNVIGSFVIGLVFVGATEYKLVSDDFRIGLMVGFLGGFTTFSAYSIESLQMFEQGRLMQSLLYFLGSPVLGVVSCFVGIWSARSAGLFMKWVGMTQ